METTLYKRDGKVSMDKSFDLICSLLQNGVYTLKIVKKTTPRSFSQNALMWMWFKCMEEATGQSKDDFHDYYKCKFLRRQILVKGQLKTVIGSTTTLNTIQMTDYLNKIQADAATEFGITLPLPEDKMYADFVANYSQR